MMNECEVLYGCEKPGIGGENDWLILLMSVCNWMWCGLKNFVVVIWWIWIWLCGVDVDEMENGDVWWVIEFMWNDYANKLFCVMMWLGSLMWWNWWCLWWCYEFYLRWYDEFMMMMMWCIDDDGVVKKEGECDWKPGSKEKRKEGEQRELNQGKGIGNFFSERNSEKEGNRN